MKTLYNTVQQYESILDPDRNKVMSHMTDVMIRKRIQEYCEYNEQKYKHGELWVGADPCLTITKIDKDEKGWYVDTSSVVTIYLMFESREKSFYDYCSSCGQQLDKQKGFLIEGTGIYFRWRKHEGNLKIINALNLESTEGLPEELNILDFSGCCQKSKKLDVCNKINIISLYDIKDLKISGNGCKNVIIKPDSQTNITVPSRTKIHQPKTKEEYWALMRKFRS